MTDNTSIVANSIDIPQIDNPADIPSNHMTEDEFLMLRGVGYTVGDASIDKVGGANMFYLSEKQRQKTLADINHQNEQYHIKRAKAKDEYKALVAEGLIIPKTEIEKTITKAHGHPDLESTKAARRMATKYGIDWKTGKPLDLFKLTDEDIEKAWDDLSDVPFTEDRDGTLVLDCDWRNYPQGTDRETIWHDFDMAHSKGVHYLIYERDAELADKAVEAHIDCTFLNNGGNVMLAYEKQETKQVPRFENKYYIPELDINGTAEELFIEVRNGYCDKQPEKIAKIAELIENEAQVNHDSELTHKAEIVRAAHEVATADVSGLADKRMNVAQMKYDLLTNDSIYDIDEVPLDDLGGTTASVKYENDTVLISVSDTYKDGNDTVYAQGASSYTREEFLNFSQTDFNAAIGSIIAYSMNETDRVAGKPEKEKSIIERD